LKEKERNPMGEEASALQRGTQLIGSVDGLVERAIEAMINEIGAVGAWRTEIEREMSEMKSNSV
jgi:hypothetical protein